MTEKETEQSGHSSSATERQHALGVSMLFHHGCETKGNAATFATPDTNGRLRCCECGAFCRTSGGETHVEPHPIPFSERQRETATDRSESDA